MTDQVSAGPTAGSRDKTKRWLWRALILSLSVNLLIAGIFIGTQLSRHAGHDRDSFAQSLEGERRQIFSELAREKHERAAMYRKQIRAKQAAAVKLLEAEPFDRAKLVAAIDDILKDRVTARRERADQFLKMVDQMTPEERHAFVAWYEAKRKHRRGRSD
jgi:Spy/CpxP family protein refolding chaperone